MTKITRTPPLAPSFVQYFTPPASGNVHESKTAINNFSRQLFDQGWLLHSMSIAPDGTIWIVYEMG